MSAAAHLLGKVIKVNRIGLQQIPCVQVRCRQNEFSDYLKMYFAKSHDFWAVAKSVNVQLGDSVLIRPVSQSDRPTTTVTHSVTRVVMPYGDIRDPVTGKRIIQREFLEDRELRQKLVEQVVEDGEQEDAVCFESRHQGRKERLEELRQEKA